MRGRRLRPTALLVFAVAVALAVGIALVSRPGARGEELGHFNVYPDDGPGASAVTRVWGRAYDGEQSLSMTTRKPEESLSPYARTQFPVDWRANDEVWYGAAFYLPEGFHDERTGYVALMRWDNYGHADPVSRGGIAIWTTDGRAHVFRERSDRQGQDELAEPFSLSEGRWHWVEVHQRFSTTDGRAINEVYVDGMRRGGSTASNFYGDRITRVRFGLVATGGTQKELRLWLDRPSVSSSQRGRAD